MNFPSIDFLEHFHEKMLQQLDFYVALKSNQSALKVSKIHRFRNAADMLHRKPCCVMWSKLWSKSSINQCGNVNGSVYYMPCTYTTTLPWSVYCFCLPFMESTLCCISISRFLAHSYVSCFIFSSHPTTACVSHIMISNLHRRLPLVFLRCNENGQICICGYITISI